MFYSKKAYFPLETHPKNREVEYDDGDQADDVNTQLIVAEEALAVLREADVGGCCGDAQRR